MNGTSRRGLLQAAGALAIWPFRAGAQEEFPSRVVKIIVPFPPGGSGDALARVISQPLSAMWKQPVILEHKPGAGTAIATALVAKSPPDGHTLGLVNTSFLTNPALRTTLPYDTKDLIGVAPLASVRLMVLVHPSVPANNIRELLEFSRKTPVNYGTPGTGSATHLVGELLNSLTGSKLTHVPYRGSAPAIVELLGGRIQAVIDAYTATNAQHVKTGKLRLIAVIGDERSPEFPNVPTVREAYPEFEAPGFMGLIAPVGTPRPLLVKLNRDIVAAAQVPEVNAQILSIGLDKHKPMDVDAFNLMLRTEMAKWANVIKNANIQVE